MDEKRRASCQYGSLECTKWKTDVDQTGIPTPVTVSKPFRTLAFSCPLDFLPIEFHMWNFC